MGTPLICPSPARTRCVALLLPLLLRLVVERKERKKDTHPTTRDNHTQVDVSLSALLFVEHKSRPQPGNPVRSSSSRRRRRSGDGRRRGSGRPGPPICQS